MLNVTIKHLKAFVELAKCQSYAEASIRLNITQPALSICIRNLEGEVGGVLFNRTTRLVALTPEGEAFFPKAKKLLLDWTSVFEEVHQLFSLQQGKLTIAAMPSFASSHLPLLLQQYRHLHANIRIDVMDVVMEKVISSVRSGEVELGIVFKPDNLAELHFDSILENRFIVVTDSQHSLKGHQSMALTEVGQFPLVVMNRGSSIRQWLDNSFYNAGIKPQISAEAWQLDTLGEMVSAKLGIAIVPELCLQHMLNKGLHCIRLKDSDLKREVGLVYKQKGTLSAPATAFKQMILPEPGK